MKNPDISIVLNLHREGRYVSKSMASLTEAVIYARAAGISNELIAVLDRADAPTVKAFGDCDLRAFDSTKIIEVDNGSLGLSRNDGCAAACGAYIATADADDLVSFNYFERMFLESQRHAHKKIIFIPKFIFAFGRDYHVAEYFDLDEITPFVLIKDHPFLSRVFFHRTLFAALQYADAKSSPSYAYEDWHFNCEAIALGYEVRAVPETILFYRQRFDSLLNNANLNSARQIPPSAFFQPQNYLRVCRPYISRFDNGQDPRLGVAKESRPALADLICQELILAAQAIEPAVHLDRFHTCGQWNYLQADIGVGIAYARLCEFIGDNIFDEVFLLPFLTTGGADQYILNIMQELNTQLPDHRMLVLFGEPFDRYAWLEKLPSGCVHIDLCRMFPDISVEDRDLICLKLVQACAPSARLHLKSSVFAQRFFNRFATVLSAHRTVFYRFSDAVNFYGNIALIEPSPFQFLSENLEYLNLMVCDNDAIRKCDQNRFGLFPDKWQLLYAKSLSSPKPLLQQLKSAAVSRSLLWASRLDREKRPELVIRIADKIRQRMPEFTLDVFGKPTLHNFDTRQLSSIPNVRYRGGFSSFKELKAYEYFCYIYTSLFDGMPNILTEAAEGCCPIVAPDVGGIPELIKDRETGILLRCTGDDESDAELYVQAVETLLSSPELRQRVLTQAYELVSERHHAVLFAANVKRIFGIDRELDGKIAEGN